MLNEKYGEILDSLLERTKNREMEWQSTSREGEYIIYLQGYSISLIQVFVGYEMVLRSENGKVIDDFTIRFGDPYWEKAQEIFSTARRQALKIDEAVEEVIKQLRSA